MSAGRPDDTGSMAFRAYWRRIGLRIETALRQWIPELFDDLPAAQLEAVLRSLRAGKRIRGCLCCLTCEALSGDVEAAFAGAVAIECIHAASLIHDDYVDGDARRRDRPAEWTLQGSRRAVLLGDVIFGTVIHRMAERSVAEGGLVASVIASMAKGAYREHLDRARLLRPGDDRGPDPQAYEAVIQLKTGVLFGAAAQLGAIAASASAPLCARSFAFGARLGEAYQIADDLVDVVGLEQAPPSRWRDLSAAAPILFRFSPTTRAGLEQMLDATPRRWNAWAGTEMPLIRERMGTEIAARCGRATAELAHFPENRFTRLLREMPADIVRSMAAETPNRPATGG